MVELLAGIIVWSLILTVLVPVVLILLGGIIAIIQENSDTFWGLLILFGILWIARYLFGN